jgi:hypothetical protein
MSKLFLPASRHLSRQCRGGCMSLCHNNLPPTASPLRLRQVLRRLLILLLLAGPLPAFAVEAEGLQLEVQLSEPRPYVQQTVLLKLRISHSPAVTTLDVDPVNAGDFTLELLAGPPRTTRPSGPQQMTTDFVYALTPLVSGPISVPPLQVRAVEEGGSGTDEPQAPAVIHLNSEPLGLEVQRIPDDAGARLPLYALDVTLRYDPRQRLQVGQPFEVSIVQKAVGASGERLSDAAALLAHPDFRVYPGQSRTSSRLLRNGQLLQGQRTDTLMLVPLRDGQLQLPSIALPWWDASRGRADQASLPGRPVQVRPEPGSAAAAAVVPQARALSAAGTVTAASLWQVIVGLLLAFAAGWWLRGRCQRRKAASDERQPRWRDLLQRLQQRALAIRQGWRPARERRKPEPVEGDPKSTGKAGVALQRQAEAVGRLAARMSRPLAPWLETARLRKELEAAADAPALRQCLLAWGSEVLGLPAQTTLMELGRTLARAYPQVAGTRINALLAELDASLYGARLAPELTAWKKALSDELDGLGARRPFRAVAFHHHHGLPALNPG